MTTSGMNRSSMSSSLPYYFEGVSWPHISFQEIDVLLRLHNPSTSSLNSLLSDGITPLGNACRHNREDLVTIFLNHGAEPNKSSKFFNKRPLHFACDHSDGNLGIVRKLLDAEADVDALDIDGNSGLHLACTESNLPVVKLLVSHGANLNIPDVSGETALIRACFANCIEMIDFLLKSGSDPNFSNGQALEMAVKVSSFESLKLLVEAGANLDQGDLMQYACEQNHIEMMKVLHNYGVDIDHQNMYGMTPLHTACMSNLSSANSVQLLLQWGAKVNALSYMKENALHYACLSQNMEKIRVLIAYNVDVNVCDSHHLSPMLMAFRCPDLSQTSIQIASLLLAAGVQVTSKCVTGLKSLMSYIPESQDKHELLNLMNLCVSHPLSLQWLCRLKIRSTIKSNIDENVQSLPLPPQILRFLNFQDILGDEVTS